MKIKSLTRNFRKAFLLSLVGFSGFYSLASDAQVAQMLTDTEKDKIRTSLVADNPLNIASLDIPALVMIVLGKDHKLFTEAYNDYTDLDEKDKMVLNIMFDPAFQYYGLFDNALCYKLAYDSKNLENYDASTTKDLNLNNGFWYPVSYAKTKSISLKMWNDNTPKDIKYCDGASGEWSGNFLNYVTSSRMDVVRKVLYGGKRLTKFSADKFGSNNEKTTVYYKSKDSNGIEYKSVLLVHTPLLRDAHGWGKVFSPKMYEDKVSYYDFVDIKPKNDNNDALFLGMGGEDDQLDRSGFLRYGFVENAGLPGSKSIDSNASHFIWDWTSNETGDNTTLRDKKNGQVIGVFANRDAPVTKNVIVVACMGPKFTSDASCYNYGTDQNPSWRPIGVLQEYDGNSPESPIKFGLLTSTWVKNISQGQVRANVGDFAKELNTETGDFKYKGVACSNTNKYCGFVTSLDLFRIADANPQNQYKDCTREKASTILKGITDNQCRDWGNPVGTLLYQSATYFQGNNKSFVGEDKLGLMNVTYEDPYKTQKYCAKPVSLLIADDAVTHDGGTYNKIDSSVTSNIKDLKLFPENTEKKYLMGYSGADTSNAYNYYPSIKKIDDLGDVIGIAPSSAFEYGSYNVAAVANYFSSGKHITATDNEGTGKKAQHEMETYVVAMKSNMPEIKIAIPGETNKYVTIVPFGISPNYQGTGLISFNQVADFFTEYINEKEGVFRINYEDYEYGSDYDMDWIVEYYYKVYTGKSGENYIRVQLRHVEGDPYASQKAGYVITGVEHQDVYIDLEKASEAQNMTQLDLDNIMGDMHVVQNPGVSNNQDSIKQAFDISNWKDGYGKKYNSIYSEKNNTARKNYCQTPKTKPFGKNDLNSIALFDKNINNNFIDTYYKTISNIAKYYYGNRKFFSENLSNVNVYDINGGENTSPDRRYYLFGQRNRCAFYDSISISSRTFKMNAEKGDAVWLKSPLWYAAKYGLMPDRGERETSEEPSNYFLVTNPSLLKDGITQMLEQLSKATHSASSFSPETTSTTAGTAVVATQFEKSTWWGDVVMTTISGKTGGYSDFGDSVKWRASTQFENMASEQNLPNRVVVTYDYVDEKLVRLYSKVDDKSSDSDSALGYLGINVFNKITDHGLTDSNVNDASNDDLHEFMNKFVRWYLGESKYEHPTSKRDTSFDLEFNDAKPLRERKSSNMKNDDGSTSTRHFVLGDIIDSDAKIFSVGEDKFVVVGANDGMIHFIDYENGNPIISYVPTSMLSYIRMLARQDFVVAKHKFMINSTPEILKINNKVYVYGNYGYGFKGGYALNVTNLINIKNAAGGDNKFTQAENADLLHFELTEQGVLQTPGGASQTYGSQYVGKMNHAPSEIKQGENVYFLYASGFDAQKNGLFIVDFEGKDETCNNVPKKRACVITEIPFDKDQNNTNITDPWNLNRKNGVAAASLVQLDSTSSKYEAIYAGDLFGNLWKVDLTRTYNDVHNWGKAINGTQDTPHVIFKAVDTEGVAQPITGRVGVGHVDNGVMLIFGTGSFTHNIDNELVSQHYNKVQSIYAMRDMTSSHSISSVVYGGAGHEVVRCGQNPNSSTYCLQQAVSNTSSNGDKDVKRQYILQKSLTYGWYVDLMGRNNTENSGERVYTDPLIVGEEAYITVNTPNTTDPCIGAGISSLFNANLLTGMMNEEERFESLAKSPTLTVHNGKLVVHVPLDPVTQNNPTGGDPQVYNKELPNPGTKQSSRLRLY